MNRLLGVVLLCGLVGYCPAVERHVPGEYPTIQKAIDAAQDGDTVLVQRGSYHESLRFRGKAITVRAADLGGGEALRRTTIVGRTKGSCFVFDQNETPESVLEGFALSEGRGSTVTSKTGSFTAGGGVLCVNSSPTIGRCWILAGDAPYGGGIAVFGDS